MKISRHRMCLLVFLAGLFFLAGTGAAQDHRVAVIVNPATPIVSADARLLASIYSLNTQSWKDGTRIAMFVLQGNQKLVDQFHRYIGHTPLELRKIWLRYQLSGEGKSPMAISSEHELVDRVAAQPGAIGFVSAEAVKPEVKVIAWIE